MTESARSLVVTVFKQGIQCFFNLHFFVVVVSKMGKKNLSVSAHQAFSCGACQTPVINCDYEWHSDDPGVDVTQAHKHT